MRITTILTALLAMTSVAGAETPRRPLVVELFTSEGCSSCPPADALLTELARTRADILPLAFHVTYWNSLGWRDPFSLDAATARQRAYGSLAGVYTPQMVIEGRHDAIGSDRASVARALRAAAAKVEQVPLRLAQSGAEIAVDVGAASGAGRVLLVGYDAQHRTHVGRGENAGLTLLESNVVRSLTVLGDWRGEAIQLRHATPEGERMAVLLQAADGRILGAATL
jgi:hypothetical protein